MLIRPGRVLANLPPTTFIPPPSSCWRGTRSRRRRLLRRRARGPPATNSSCTVICNTLNLPVRAPPAVPVLGRASGRSSVIRQSSAGGARVYPLGSAASSDVGVSASPLMENGARTRTRRRAARGAHVFVRGQARQSPPSRGELRGGGRRPTFGIAFVRYDGVSRRDRPRRAGRRGLHAPLLLAGVWRRVRGERPAAGRLDAGHRRRQRAPRASGSCPPRPVTPPHVAAQRPPTPRPPRVCLQRSLGAPRRGDRSFKRAAASRAGAHDSERRV